MQDSHNKFNIALLHGRLALIDRLNDVSDCDLLFVKTDNGKITHGTCFVSILHLVNLFYSLVSRH